MSIIGLRQQSHLTNPVPWLERFPQLIPTLSDLAFVLPILVLFWSTTGVAWLLTDSDTGWHIRTGEYILAKHAVPTHDLFSFTKPGAPWFAWEWLTDTWFGLLFRMGGLKGNPVRQANALVSG